MYHYSPAEPVRHIDKTRQDRSPVNQRPRVAEWLARHGNPMANIVKAARRNVALQRTRIAAGTFDLRHMNAFIRDRGVVSAGA